MSTLFIQSNNPSTLPDGGYQISYRPKGSTQPYYVIKPTSLPVHIATNIIKNVDYEGFVQSICNGSPSKSKVFSTSNFNNAVGLVKVKACDHNYSGNILSVKFDNQLLLPLNNNFPLGNNTSGDFVSNQTGTKTLLISHSFSNSTVKVTDSNQATFIQNTTGGMVTFLNVTISASTPFSIEIGCNPVIL
jgi:hypothetical protein